MDGDVEEARHTPLYFLRAKTDLGLMDDSTGAWKHNDVA